MVKKNNYLVLKKEKRKPDFKISSGKTSMAPFIFFLKIGVLTNSPHKTYFFEEKTNVV